MIKDVVRYMYSCIRMLLQLLLYVHNYIYVAYLDINFDFYVIENVVSTPTFML